MSQYHYLGKSSISGKKYEIYKEIQTWDDYNRDRKAKLAGTDEPVVTAEDLAYDCARGILKFQPRNLLMAQEVQERNAYVMYIEDSGQMRSVYCKKPQYHRAIEKDGPDGPRPFQTYFFGLYEKSLIPMFFHFLLKA